MDYASVDFWMKMKHIYRSTLTFLTLLTSPHLVFSLVPKNNNPYLMPINYLQDVSSRPSPLRERMSIRKKHVVRIVKDAQTQVICIWGDVALRLRLSS